MSLRIQSILLRTFIILLLANKVHAVTVLGVDAGANYVDKQQSQKLYFLQLASFKKQNNAYRLKKTLHINTQYRVKIIPTNEMYRVVVGPMTSVQQLRQASKRLGAFIDFKPSIIDKSNLNIDISLSHKTKKRELNKESTQPFDSESINELFVRVGTARVWNLTQGDILVNNGSDYPQPYNHDRFTLIPHNSYIVSIEAGKEKLLKNRIFYAIDLSLRYQHNLKQNYEGQVIQYSLSEFTNYNYHWKGYNNALSVSTKLLIDSPIFIHPYVNASIGVSFNHLKEYTEQFIQGVAPRLSPAFGSHTSTQFTYGAGAGIEWFFSNNYRFGLGYEFQNFGKFKSANGAGTWSSESLDTYRLKTNSLVLSFQKSFG